MIYAPIGVADSIVLLDEAEASEHSEDTVQIYEATKYEYESLVPGCLPQLTTGSGVFKRSSNPNLTSSGTMELGSYVGRLRLQLVDQVGNSLGTGALEVRSRKLGYRDDLRTMIEEITEHAVELAFDLRSPTTLRGVPDPSSDPKVLYQQFAFLSALIDAKSFKDALFRITTRPHERLDQELESRSLRRGIKPNATSLRQLAKGGNRFPVPAGHPLRGVVSSLPATVLVPTSSRSDDTAENRFVRFVLETFSEFLERVVDQVGDSGREEHVRLVSGAKRLLLELEVWLSSAVLANASDLRRIPFESTVLQRKEGYREVLQAWLKFDLAARLVWEGASDVYDLGRRDVASLYEYWVFFKLLEIFTSKFVCSRSPAHDLIEATGDHLGVKLKAGKNISIRGHAIRGEIQINARLDYNRCFTRRVPVGAAGSWTQRMRPDYTLSLWVGDVSEAAAEMDGTMVHVHFDAKYRVDDLSQLFGSSLEDEAIAEQALNQEDKEQAAGVYKRADLLKMHAYRDAIRRSFGAYVLYPGTQSACWTGFHELLPGLGAFVLRPGAGLSDVATFFDDVISHVANGSTRQEIATRTAELYSGATSGFRPSAV